MPDSIELYGTPGCSYTSELREQLLWEDKAFTEYDVEADQAALRRMLALTDGQRTVPVLVEDGRVSQIGWQGRGCTVALPRACSIMVRGIVQGVGFRPFVFRLAAAHGVTGWVLNGDDGVEIHAEGNEAALASFIRDIENRPPPAARIESVEVSPADVAPFDRFRIIESVQRDRPTTRISADLSICEDCLAELSEPSDRRFGYPYINCTNCGPRFSIILGLPYDRLRTTMRDWEMCSHCVSEYSDPLNRRFHAQPLACGTCGPHFVLRVGAQLTEGDDAAIEKTVGMLRAGEIVAIKGLGGYHLTCDADCSAAVSALRTRKFRKERPFALMARDIDAARDVVELSPEAEALLTSRHRPIVLAPARVHLAGVSPENLDLGVMLPYTPLHHLLFARGAPKLLVMTSANHSSEPIAYRDDDALDRLSDIAGAFLIGERSIARRVDDSVVRVGALGPVVLRRSRGYAPGAVARLPTPHPVLAVGADLKNTVTLVIGGAAVMSQHIGDLEHHDAYLAFEETIRDLMSMHDVGGDDLCVVHDLHPQYASTSFALAFPAPRKYAVQHHRAHVASVLAERGALAKRVIGVAFDGTGYGDDGAIWGGELFAGSILDGFRRVAHLRGAVVPGGDAAARWPVQAAAGFLAGLDGLPDLSAPPFRFPARHFTATQLVEKGVRTFTTTSAGRLFDTAAALLGFTREVTFEGQAAIWLEQLARGAAAAKPYAVPFARSELDFRPALLAIADDRLKGRDIAEIARAFHRGLARGIADAVVELCEEEACDTAVMSGGVFQNDLLLADVAALLGRTRIEIWTNRDVPPNDGGISLGQAALSLQGASTECPGPECATSWP
ncbi:MAG: carbamoyltransferase HypF [Gemmatimonadaceae bacterium]